MSTAAEKLAEVEAAISAVLKAQEYTFEGRSVKRADLKELRELKQELQAEVNRASRGGLRLTGISIRH